MTGGAFKNTTKKVLQVLLILTIAIASCNKDEQVIVSVGGLKGVVTNEFGQPIEGALINVGPFSARTGFYGTYSFDNLEAKEYSVSVSKEKFITKVENITIGEYQVKELNFTLNTGQSYITISDSIFNKNASAGEESSINVFSNSGWIINNSSTWLVCSTTSGQGNGSLSISWSENKGKTARRDTIKFQSGEVVKNLIIIQSPPIMMVSFEGIIGNHVNKITDSVYIRFNKPIKVSNIQSHDYFCSNSSDLNYKLVDGNCGIKFTYGCAVLGGNYSFTISVFDELGNTLTQKVNIPFYKSIFSFQAIITDYQFLNNDAEILIAATSPNRIIRYSIEHDSIIQLYDLSIAPKKISLNPYDSKIYIVDSKQPDIYTLNLQTGQLIKAITLSPLPEDHPEYPAIIPYDIEFTKSGLGIILVRSQISNIFSWKIIDCGKNYLIYKYPTSVINHNYFEEIKVNFNQSKLILTGNYLYGNDNYWIFDENTKDISILSPNHLTEKYSATPSRKSEKIYFGLPYGIADFIYWENEDEFVCFNWHNFSMIDYSDSQIVMTCDAYMFTKLRSTLDGKYLIGYINTDTSSKMYVFETKYLFRHLK